MKRLIEKTVFSGFTAACRRASCPTRRSPDLVKATTEGVVREPSELGMTTGSPPSMTAMTELVVPRSIPTVFGICQLSSRVGWVWIRSEYLRFLPRISPGKTPARSLYPMAIYELDPVDLIAIAAVGEPGQRRFFLLATG